MSPRRRTVSALSEIAVRLYRLARRLPHVEFIPDPTPEEIGEAVASTPAPRRRAKHVVALTEYAMKGALPSARIGRHLRFSRRQLEALLAGGEWR